MLAHIEPPKDNLTPEEYRDYIVGEIVRLGIADQLSFKEFIVMYSGPSRGIRQIIVIDLSNRKMSELMAGDLEASRIDDTEAAKFLNGQKLREYFEPEFNKRYKDDELDNALEEANVTVWSGISGLYAKQNFRHVATTVCGADRKRVFIRHELQPLVDNKSVETINGIFHAAVREVFERVGSDAAFDLLCRSEINFMHALAVVGKRGADEYEKEIAERLRFYKLERDLTPDVIKLLNAKQLAKREEIMSRYGYENLYATEPETWSKQVTPILPVIPLGKAPTSAGYTPAP